MSAAAATKPELFKQTARYAVIALAVWLGWQVVREPIAERATPALSLRLAPASPNVLQRAAEVEFEAGRADNADELARASLAMSPFNARSLRLIGLVEAGRGNVDKADELITIAGNWSLRDDAAHGWLVERRLRTGDYESAFAHADTLIRRKVEFRPNVYRLFTTAALIDRRALRAVVNRLAVRPPWRSDYVETLKKSPRTAGLLATIVIALERTDGRFDRDELRLLYLHWLGTGQLPAARFLHDNLQRSAATTLVANSSMEATQGVEPFAWMLGSGVGISTSLSADDQVSGNSALRVDYDGYSSATALSQLLLLEPGAYAFKGRVRQELGTGDPRMTWQLVCVETGMPVATRTPSLHDLGAAWSSFSFEVRVPASNCSAQWLRLQGVSGSRREQRIIWYDDVEAIRLPSASQRAS